MELTAEEQGILDGAQGEYKAGLMRLLVDWGRSVGARRLVPVQSVMAAGINPVGSWARESYAGAEARQLAELGRWLRHGTGTATLTHGTQVDERTWTADELQRQVQRQIIDQALDAGVLLTWTCAPYLTGEVPTFGMVCAWTESSAVVYINGMLGARSTRHGNQSANAAAVLGVVPEFGTLTDEGRRGTLQIDVAAQLRTPSDWGALGYFAGERAGLGVPVFTGISRAPTVREAMQLSAALATTGGVSMFHIVGFTPEAPTLAAAFSGVPPASATPFGPAELAAAYDRIGSGPGRVDYVVCGCPHAPLGACPKSFIHA